MVAPVAFSLYCCLFWIFVKFVDSPALHIRGSKTL